MSCNCNSPAPVQPSPMLPSITDVANFSTCGCSSAPTECCEADCIDGTPSGGATLPVSLTDARCAGPTEGVTLLGRIGTSLARFTGNGFLQLIAGKAYVVSSLPLVIRQLWHGYWVSNGGTVPVPGDPKNFPFGVVADLSGNLYGIQGFTAKRALHVWNFTLKTWETISPDQFPLEVSRRITASEGIELVGFDPISVLNSPTVVRALKVLSGQGIVYLTQVAVGVDDPPAGCDACEESAIAYVARVLPFPTITPGAGETGRHQLVYSSLGLYFDPEA